MILLTPTAMQIGVLAKNKLRCLHLLLLLVKQTSVCEEGERTAARTQDQPRRIQRSIGKATHWKHNQISFQKPICASKSLRIAVSSGALLTSDFPLLWGRHGFRPALTQAWLRGPWPSSPNEGPLHTAVLETLRTGSLGAHSGGTSPQAQAAARCVVTVGSRLPLSYSSPKEGPGVGSRRKRALGKHRWALAAGAIGTFHGRNTGDKPLVVCSLSFPGAGE